MPVVYSYNKSSRVRLGDSLLVGLLRWKKGGCRRSSANKHGDYTNKNRWIDRANFRFGIQKLGFQLVKKEALASTRRISTSFTRQKWGFKTANMGIKTSQQW